MARAAPSGSLPRQARLFRTHAELPKLADPRRQRSSGASQYPLLVGARGRDAHICRKEIVSGPAVLKFAGCF